MIQAVALFLIGMAVLSIYARFRRPPAKKPPSKLAAPALCAQCGRLTVANRPCVCQGGKGSGKG